MRNELLLALQGKNAGRPPVWLMRQAGRYLPAYRALREKHRLLDLFFTPALAAEVTLMPLRSFDLDAAILFSDITVVARALGLTLDFAEGPVLSPRVAPGMQFRHSMEQLDPIIEAVKVLKPQLTVPLIGFCGGPFTVASYLIGDLEETKKWIDHDSFSHLLDQIADVSVEYLRRQVAAGVDVVQIFDSWANVLSEEQWRTFSLPYIKRFVESIDVPAIFFMRGAARYVDEIPCAVSLDWETDMATTRQRTKKTLQGNLNPDLLFEPLPIVREKTEALLQSMHGDPAFILNLGHGVKPGTPIEAVRCLVATVRGE